MRTVLATLGLGFLEAVFTGGVSAAATPLAAGLAGGVAGNLATDLFKHVDRKICERFLDGWSGIDENHYVVAALRLAQIDALRALIAKFEGTLGKQDDRLGDQAGFGFAARVKSFLSEETKVAQARSFPVGSADIDERKAVIALLPDTFDDALAARRDSNERGEAGSTIAQVRSVAEAAVLDELRVRCGDSAKRIPLAFEDFFLGKEGVSGWFDLFVRDAADKLTHPNSEFAAIWNAEQTALIKAYVEAQNVQTAEVGSQVEVLRANFVSGMQEITRARIAVDKIAEHPLRLAAENALLALRTMPSRLQEAVDAGATSFNFEGARKALEDLYAVSSASSRPDVRERVILYQANYNGYLDIIRRGIARLATIEEINAYHNQEIVGVFEQKFADLLEPSLHFDRAMQANRSIRLN